MTVAVIHDDDGKITILRSGNEAGVRADADASGSDYVITDEDVDADQHYVRVTTDEIVAYPKQPSEVHVFNYATETWEWDINLAKAQAWANIKLDRDDDEFGDFTWNNWVFEADADSQARITAAVQSALLDDAFTTTWTLKNNTTQSLDCEQIKQLGKALGDHIKQAHERGRIVRAQIDAATTTEELEAISW